jgi:hypothetical protein
MSSKGTRLPEDWEPSKEDIQYLNDKRKDLSLAFKQVLIEDFVDFYKSEAGLKAYKVDWARTFKRWCRHWSVPFWMRAKPTYNDSKTFMSDDVAL